MTRWGDIWAEDVMRLYCQERHRRENPPSITGTMDLPHVSSPPSGTWEDVLLLTLGVSRLALDVVYLRYYGRAGHEVEYIPVGESHVDDLRAIRPPWRAVGERLGITATEAQRLCSQALSRVSDMLGRRRALGRHVW